uniref:Uncharacterized protein n=1 Tax=Rhizophora mucronata TaxID=61149 RepID=A0A2P2P992_RHIMU
MWSKGRSYAYSTSVFTKMLFLLLKPVKSP